MNAFQICTNTSDAVPLYLPQQLYLKPIARINITVQLTQKLLGKTITHHELMERLRDLIRPDEFTLLKVTKTTLEIIRFEAEVELKKHLQRVVGKLDGKMIKLKEFSELMKVRAAEAKLDFPKRHDWDVYFRDAKDMNEMKPGERPDTVHISNLPTKWFVPRRLVDEENLLPFEKIFYNTFEKYGKIRNVDIPICDPYRKKMKAHITGIQTSSLDETEYFEGYIQFKDYIGFSKCMEAISCKKLLRKEDGEAVSINIYVDFDKTKHLSDASLRRREIVRDRLVLKQKDVEAKEKETREEKQKNELAERQKEIAMKKDKEKRRREREEKRKAKIMAELKVKGSDDITDKIAREEKKLLKVQRRLEAIRLVEELFKRIKTKLDKDPVVKKYKNNDELSKIKALTEFEVETRRDKLHKAIEGRVILKSIIAHQSKDDNSTSSSESPLISENEEKVYPSTDMAWYNYLQNTLPAYNHLHSFYNQQRFPYYIPPRGRLIPGPSGRRPYNNRGRSRAMNHYLNQESYKHAQNGIYRNYKRSRSYTKSRSRSRSHSRHRSRSYSRERSRYRTRSPSRRRTKSPSRRRSKSRRSTRTRSRSRRRSRSRIRSRSKTKSP